MNIYTIAKFSLRILFYLYAPVWFFYHNWPIVGTAYCVIVLSFYLHMHSDELPQWFQKANGNFLLFVLLSPYLIIYGWLLFMPFRDVDYATDIGIAILKDGFVRFLLAILDISILIGTIWIVKPDWLKRSKKWLLRQLR